MAYITKIIGPEEELIGIARLHWVYVIRGLFWFLVMAGSGWLLNMLAMKAGVLIGSSFSSNALPLVLMKISNAVMFFMMAGGLAIFCFFVLKVLVTEIGLSSRRVIHKEGFLFVKVHQIDHEEIRGENLDLGYFGRILGYGVIMLDCRFVGDVTLPAIENPERFLRTLHKVRSSTQDALSLMVGKGASNVPLNIKHEQDTQQPQPPTPEIQPGQPGPQPEVQPDQPQEAPPMPTPHNPPPAGTPPAPEQPPVELPQPSPAPIPGGQPSSQQFQAENAPSNITLPSQIAAQNVAPQDAATQTSAAAASPALAAQPQPAALDANAMAEMMRQMMPQMAEQVAKQLVEQGAIPQKDAASPDEPADEKNIDMDLIASFGQASGEKDSHDVRNKVEHAIH